MLCQKKSAFTLVELLIVISVIGILSASGLAAYVNFNRSQVIVQATDKVISDLHLAQSLALNNQKPEAVCEDSPLVGYSFKINDKKSYTISAVCANASFLIVKQAEVLSVIEIGPEKWEAVFKVLRQGVDRPAQNIIVNNSFGKPAKEIIVGEGGEIRLK